MYRNGWILLLILICVAFLVSCGKKETTDLEKAELVRIEVPGEYFPGPLLLCASFRCVSIPVLHKHVDFLVLLRRLFADRNHNSPVPGSDR